MGAVLLVWVGLTAGLSAASNRCWQDPPPQGTETPSTSPGSASPDSTSTTPATVDRGFIHGFVKTRYDRRWTGNDSDQDVVSTIALDLGDAEHDTITAHLMGRLAYDLDGRNNTFAGISDSYGGRFDALLYDAYIDVHKIGGLSLVRLGRQSVIDTPEVAYFDGGHIATQEFGALALQVGAYAGASTRLYEASESGDLTAGGYAQVRPWTDGRVRLDYMHLEGDRRLGSNKDDLLGASVWQSIGKQLQLDAQYSRIVDRDRDVQTHAVYRSTAWGLMLRVSWYRLLTTQGDLVLEADPFFNALNELRPYDQWSLIAAKDISRVLNLQAAADLRRVRQDIDVGTFNRDYDRYYGTVSLHDFGVGGVSLSGTADFWDSNGQLVRSLGGDVSYQYDKSTASVGTYYSLYKYDLFTNSERDHVRTYYLKLRHKVSAALTFEGNYELEDSDLDRFYRFRLGVTWRF